MRKLCINVKRHQNPLNRFFRKPMLFAVKTYDEQYNANGINNMEQLSCHHSPLPVCGTIQRNVIKNINNNNKTVTNTTNTKIIRIAVKELKEKSYIQYDNESLQTFEDSKHFLLKQLKFTVEDDVRDISHPPHVTNDLTCSISYLKYPKGHQGHFYRERFTPFLHSTDLRRQRLQSNKKNERLITWHNTQLAI